MLRLLTDLPQNLKYLVINPFFTLLTLGLTSSGYYVSGNVNRTPVYLVEEFHYDLKQATFITSKHLMLYFIHSVTVAIQFLVNGHLLMQQVTAQLVTE